MLVIRDGKTMTRIAAQLYALEKQGDSLLARKITHFVNAKYEQHKVGHENLVLWNKLYTIYGQLTQPRARQMASLHTINSDISSLITQLREVLLKQDWHVSVPAEAHTYLMPIYWVASSERSHNPLMSIPKLLLYMPVPHIL